MKKLFFPLTLIGLCATFSCKKEVVTENKVMNVASSSMSSNITVSDSVKFGVMVIGGTPDEKIAVAGKLGVGYLRSTVILKDFKGKDMMLDKYINSGIKVILNLNYNRSGNPFPKDMVAYRQALGAVLDKYKPEVAVIENEPTTKAFYSGPIEDYITELGVAIDVCHSKGVKVADGAIHPENVLLVMGGRTLRGNAVDVQKLIKAYTTLNLDYVNVHTRGDGDAYPAGQLEKVADYIRATTGKPVMSNEFSVHSTSTSLVTSMVNAFKAGNYKYAMVFSGDSPSGAKPLHNGTTLLSNGVTFRDDIVQ